MLMLNLQVMFWQAGLDQCSKSAWFVDKHIVIFGSKVVLGKAQMMVEIA